MAGPLTADRVKQTSTTTGTGTLNLDGTIPNGAISFVSGIGNGNSCHYCISHETANEWEVGIGTVTSGSPDTLSRTTVLSSSNSGSLVTFASGVLDVFCVIAGGGFGSPLIRIPTSNAIRLAVETNLSSLVGNARGNGSLDFQPYRDNVAQVASGNYSFLGGGTRNEVSGNNSFVGCGNANLVSGVNAFIGGGNGNLVANNYGVIVGGKSNKNYASRAVIIGGQSNYIKNYSNYSTIGGGYNNKIYNNYSFVGGGVSNLCHHIYSSILGGKGNYTNGDAATVLGGVSNAALDNFSVTSGYWASASKYGQRTHASGRFAAQGDAQSSQCISRCTTTNATETELFLDGSTATRRHTLANNTSWVFEILIVARRTGVAGESAGYLVTGIISRDGSASTTAIVGTVTNTVLGRVDVAWVVAVDADTTNGSLRIQVTGEASKNIQWVAETRMVETTG